MTDPIPARYGLGPIDQVSYVVADLERALPRYEALFGPFRVGEAPMSGCTIRGKQADCTLKVAVSESGPLEVELIQVLEGETTHSEHLRAHGEGLHHVRFRVASLDEKLAELEGNGFEPDPVVVEIPTQALVPPDLAVVDYGVSDGSGNAKIDPGEVLEITARVSNLGRGEAREVRAEIGLGENVFFAKESPQDFDLGNVSVGGCKDITFTIVTNNRASGELPVPSPARIEITWVPWP